MHRWMIIAIVALALGCPRGGNTTPEQITIESIRAHAAEHPNDPRAQRALAEGELLRADGDPARAQAAIDNALRLAPDDPALYLLRGLEAYTHGRPADALEAFLVSLEKAPGDADENAIVAEVASAGVEELTHVAPDFPTIVNARLAPLVERLAPAARQTAADVLMELAYRRGDMDAVRAHADTAGCMRTWKAAGPFGPRELLGFDEEGHPAMAVGPMADSYDLGFGRGVRPTRELEARGCAVHLGSGPILTGGTTYVEGRLDLETGGRFTVRVETPNAVEVHVDGERLARLDHRREPLRRVTFHPVELQAGSHEVSVKITTRHPNPILAVSVVPAGRTEPPTELDAYTSYVRAAAQFARGNTIDARDSLRGAGDGPGSPVVRSLQAAVALANPLVTDDMRRDNARRLLRGIMERDDRAWFPVLQIARLKAAEGRDQEAIADLRAALGRWPELSTVQLSLLELLLGRGWDAEADTHIARALELSPGACPPINAALANARRRDRIADIDRYVEAAMECDARNSERFQLLILARRWDEAAEELSRLASLEPAQARQRLIPSELDVAEGRADTDAILALLNELRDLSPLADTVRLAIADRQLARGQRQAALSTLSEALEQEPASMADLRRIRTALGGEFELEGHRVDGAEVIRAFEASGRTYEEPQVLVFDYTVVRVFPDMSSIALTHQIYKLQSEEAVDEQGEFEPPPGSTMLKLQTIKPDGRVLEPDLIEGKETISLPNLAVGDYVEQEYLRVLDPPTGIPGGLLGDRFYFASFELPFDRSELVVLLPEGMDVTVDPRGQAPQTQRSTRDGHTMLRWAVTQSEPLVQEPASVAAREFIPSINWGVNATWAGFLGGLRDVLADRNVVDRQARRLAHEIVGNASSDHEKARRIYYWLLENVENNNDVFGQAAAMIAGRTGNRARALHYMLGLVDVQSSLVLGRGFGNDQTESELADEDTYSNLIVRLASNGGDDVFLQPTSRGIPFGYISPVLRGQDALVLTASDPSSAQRIVLPPAAEGEDSRRIDVTADVAADGSATVEVVETFRGHEAIQWRDDLEGVPEAMIEQRFEEAYVARILNGATLEELRITGREQPEEPFVLRYTARVPALARSDGGVLTLPSVFPTMLTPRFARVDSRTTDQMVGPPVNLTVSLRVRTPEGAPRTAMQPVSLERNGASFTMRARRDGDYLRIDRNLKVPLTRIPAQQYPAWATFCRAVDQAEARELPLR